VLEHDLAGSGRVQREGPPVVAAGALGAA
jgi:hypothetical protein